MSDYFCIAVTFLDPRFHGRGDGGEPEWPPSPLRLFQAIVAANAARLEDDQPLRASFEWLERQSPPLILVPRGEFSTPYCLSVPNNAMDIVGRAWSRGNYDGGGDANPARHRTMKDVRPIHMHDGDTLRYIWPLDEANAIAPLERVIEAARRLVALGWGIDMAVGNAERITGGELQDLDGEQWVPCRSSGTTHLRTTISGTLARLRNRHEAFLNRVDTSGFAPVTPLTAFEVTEYRRSSDPVGNSCALFELRHDDGSFCRYPQRKLMHIAGMVRHLAIEAMKQSPPGDVDDVAQWLDSFVAGHARGNPKHRQFSYLPLPSIGHEHADQAVRRVMVVAPVGDDAWLQHLVRRLAGQQLKPDPKWDNPFGEKGPPMLLRIVRDKVTSCYTAAGNRWASVTPVILPGHNDRKRSKTIKLIERALREAGIEQPCDYEWSPVSRFRKSLSAHKRHRDGHQIYFKPKYLKNYTSVHLTLSFEKELRVPGPLVIGAGRHCGFGLMASIPKESKG